MAEEMKTEYIRSHEFRVGEGEARENLEAWIKNCPSHSLLREFYRMKIGDFSDSTVEKLFSEFHRGMDFREFTDETIAYQTGKTYEEMMETEFHKENLLGFIELSNFKLSAHKKLSEYPEKLQDTFRNLHPVLFHDAKALSEDLTPVASMLKPKYALLAYYHIIVPLLAPYNNSQLPGANSILNSLIDIIHLRTEPKERDEVSFLPPADKFPNFDYYFDVPEEFADRERDNYDSKKLTLDNVQYMIKYSRERSNIAEGLSEFVKNFFISDHFSINNLCEMYMNTLFRLRLDLETKGCRNAIGFKWETWRPEEVPLFAHFIGILILEMNGCETVWHSTFTKVCEKCGHPVEEMTTEEGKFKFFTIAMVTIFPLMVRKTITDFC